MTPARTGLRACAVLDRGGARHRADGRFPSHNFAINSARLAASLAENPP
jgi:hypothetical protein